MSLSPELSGPSKVKLAGWAIDRLGLIQTRFELEPINLYVIPRARYASWLAKKYLAETRPGALPLLTDMRTLTTIYGFQRGIEYYGNRQYQPGDSLKNIDWKHSLNRREFITKEFAEFQGKPAVMLVNLAVGSAEEADKLACNIIVTAISLARENILTALAAYNTERVELTTAALEPRRLVFQSLLLAREMVTIVNPVKYLSPPDVMRLKSDINRLRHLESGPSKALLNLLEIEYGSLYDNAKHSPATRALSEVFARIDKQSNIIVISCRNGDTEALAFNEFSFARKRERHNYNMTPFLMKLMMRFFIPGLTNSRRMIKSSDISGSASERFAPECTGRDCNICCTQPAVFSTGTAPIRGHHNAMGLRHIPSRIRWPKLASESVASQGFLYLSKMRPRVSKSKLNKKVCA